MSQEENVEFGEVLEAYMEQEHMYHFESESGVRNLHKIANALGYRTGLDEMLADNPFLQQAIIEALSACNFGSAEWIEELQARTYNK